MMSRRISTLSFIIGILCLALFFTSGSANVYCHKEGNCPNPIACYAYCYQLGFKQYGGLCTDKRFNLCCCINNTPVSS
ncbi:hypothetical protein PHAVU_009G051200 [Phaseolus vulgaris]|uniref:Knottin scorpion toxin-like domain-containing protein n=1 Tax=Phaseolus vulgaris TaxID=3885 RepID=V7AV78_PHAVU|nr:hypothetical protein PHAVU_009G051200g [Phaseolus vulgaris]ESW08503.1 hypothetical protein PHAVU_009G051200g [Phaseolus vulgaris]